MSEFRVLIAAAGRGSRAGLPFPKTLFPIQGKPILVRLCQALAAYDAEPTVIVSPEGVEPVQRCMDDAGIGAHLVVQPEPLGMGHAVLQFGRSPTFAMAEHVLLVWGDIPFVQPKTLQTLFQEHLSQGNDFTFATRTVDDAYTIVLRHADGRVARVIETREQGNTPLQAGERDTGIFIFRKSLVLEALQDDVPGKKSSKTGEHGFLYIIGHLASLGYRVVALPIATEMDLVSLNSLKDVDAFL